MINPKAETLVIGGGLIGAFTAYFLACEGRSVTVLEKGFVGAQSSGANFGNLRLQGRHLRQYPLSLRAQAIWEKIESLTGESCEYDRTGHLYIARQESEVAQLEYYAKISRDFGLNIETFNARALSDRFPYLDKHIAAATFSERDATANPRLATPVVMRAAQKLGARVVENCTVDAACHTGVVFEVETLTHGRFQAEHLVNAAGAWGADFAAQFDEPVPMISAGPPQFVTESVPYLIKPSMQLVSGSAIFRQIPRGNVIVAGYPRTASEAGNRRTLVPPRKTFAGMGNLAEVAPFLRNAHVIRVWSGVEGYLPDMLPIIGPSGTQSGLFHAFGCCGHGFQIAPGIGAVLCDLITTCETKTPIEDFDIKRFKSGIETDEKLEREFDPTPR